ncbi:dihydrofolate reductase family protein [Amycolatopsis nigrescens]|uniref:dihydrofolate reductase family protein n=1 Tax=Amycolatopsis nigrescens TaxID=381445 RepID=UPI000360B5F1|nr:dihydrofolate reductase family protein [Amycolatopsis nigrescens]
MAKLVAITFMSLDGVMQAPGLPDEDRSGGFDRGGWLIPYFDEDLMQVDTEWTRKADGLLLGRKTYEILNAYWPQVTDAGNEVAAKMNSMPKYVASRTLETLGWNNSTVLDGELTEAVAKLKELPGAEIQIPGSGNLLQTLMKHDLVDEYRLLFFPILLGGGKRLFAEGTVPSALKLTSSKTSGSGVTINIYQRGGELQTGSIG